MTFEDINNKNNILRDHMLSLTDEMNWINSIRVSDESIRQFENEPWLSEIESIFVVGHGTSLATATVSTSWLVHISKIRTQSLPAFQFSQYIEDYLFEPKKTLVIGISCSGNTKSVVESLDKAGRLGAKTLCVSGEGDVECAKVAQYRIVTDAHKEKTADVSAYSISHIYLLLGVFRLTLLLGKKKGNLNDSQINYWQTGIMEIIGLRDHITGLFYRMKEIVESIRATCGNNYVVLGTGPNYGTMVEGALKICEFSWMFGAGEELEDFAHGRFREIDSTIPLLIISPDQKTTSKTLDLLAGCNISKTPTIVFTGEKNLAMEKLATYIVEMPKISDEYLTPLFYVFPLWFFGYHMRQLDEKLVGEKRHGLFAVDIDYQSHYDKTGQKKS